MSERQKISIVETKLGFCQQELGVGVAVEEDRGILHTEEEEEEAIPKAGTMDGEVREIVAVDGHSNNTKIQVRERRGH